MANFLFVLIASLLSRVNSSNRGGYDENTEAYKQAIADPRIHISTGFTSALGIGLTVFSSVLSNLSSMLLLYLILKSKVGLRSVYHRLMMTISLVEFFRSLASAFATLPMPTDMIYTEFEGIIAGNIVTCTVQGFLQSTGAAASVLCVLHLSIYFFSRIRFHLSDAQFHRRVERYMYPMVTIISLCLPVTMLMQGYFNPTPFDTGCNGNLYPYWCYKEDEPCTIRGPSATNTRFLITFGGVIFLLTSTLLLILFLMIVWSVYRQEKAFKNNNDTSTDITEADMKRTRASLVHALSYIVAYFLSSFAFWMRYFFGDDSLPYGLQISHCFFGPLRGFFHCMIFIGLKVYNIHRADHSIAVKEALKMTFAGDELVLLTNLSMVVQSSDDGQQEGGIVKDEGDDISLPNRTHPKDDGYIEDDISYPFTQVDSSVVGGPLSYNNVSSSGVRTIPEVPSEPYQNFYSHAIRDNNDGATLPFTSFDGSTSFSESQTIISDVNKYASLFDDAVFVQRTD